MIKLAIIAPSFFSYIEAIRDEFTERGIQCDIYDERHSNNAIVKIIYRIGIEWPLKKKKGIYFEKIITAINDGNYTDVLLIDTEVVDKDHVLKIKEKGIKVHIYMWDSARNKGKFLDYLNELHSRSSFEVEDCKVYNMKYIPLFSEDLFSNSCKQQDERFIDLSFCGTMHSDRSFYLYKLYKISHQMNLRVDFLLFFHSKILFFIKSLSNPTGMYFLNKIETKRFSKKYIANSMHHSKFVFDMPHKKQNGLTARTFEALRSGACLITCNKNTHTLPAELQNRIVVIKKIDDIKKIAFTDFTVPPLLTESQDYYLSISRFADQLIDLMGYDFKKYKKKRA